MYLWEPKGGGRWKERGPLLLFYSLALGIRISGFRKRLTAFFKRKVYTFAKLGPKPKKTPVQCQYFSESIAPPRSLYISLTELELNYIHRVARFI